MNRLLFAALVLTLGWVSPARSQTDWLSNAADPLPDIGYYETASVWSGVQASIVDFQAEHGMATFAGYRYWTAWSNIGETCLSGGGEDVFLQKTNDPEGKTDWTAAVKIDDNGYCDYYEPADDDIGVETATDPHLFYNEATDELWIYVAHESVDEMSYGPGTMAKIVIDNTGVVSAPVEVLTHHRLGSPVVARDPEGDLHLWFSEWIGSSKASVVYHADAANVDGTAWTNLQQVDLSNIPVYPSQWGSGDTSNYRHFWHFDAKVSPYYDGNVVDFMVGVSNGSWDGMPLIMARTTFSNPLSFSFPMGDDFVLTVPINPIQSAGGVWDGKAIYMSGFEPYRVGNALATRLWYSGIPQGIYHIPAYLKGDGSIIGYMTGYTEGSLGVALPIAEPDKSEGEYIGDFDITLQSAQVSSAVSFEYGWGTDPPISPLSYSMPFPLQLSTLWFRGIESSGNKGLWESVLYSLLVWKSANNNDVTMQTASGKSVNFSR